MTEVTPRLIQDSITDAVLAGIVTISADAIVCVDDSQRIIFFNEGAVEIFGYAEEEVMGQPLEILIPERFRSDHRAHVERFGRSAVRARRMGERGQISGLRKNGEEFPAEAAISHLGTEGQRVYSVVLRDVTERRRAHDAQRLLADAGEILASSLGSEDTLRNVTRIAVPRLADACIVNVFTGERFQAVAVAHVDEARGAELERRCTEDPIDTSGRHPVAEVMRTLRTVFIQRLDERGFRRDLAGMLDIFGSPPSAAIHVPLSARGQMLGVMSLYRKRQRYDESDVVLAEDVGRRAALAMDNARLYDLVYAGIRARDDMIGIVSHDLRNPVNAVRMLTSVMLDPNTQPPLPPEMVDYTALIRQAAEQMDALIRDLLDVTRVEAGRLQVEPVAQNTEELLSDALRTLAPVAEDKAIALRLTAPDDLPPVFADRERIGQALSNLVGNAVKFSPSGSQITVRVKALEDEVLFSVSDDGPGMTADQLAHAFDRFWQSNRTDRQGAGLGLAITKGIVDAHRGRIWAESTAGAGSSFHFTLPVAPAAG